ncbi:hypothetical protein ISN45_Aa06g035440 [Arabidopsis thaliana x Arabidopsis arenosa]|uniref:Uncharacterized protein n=1 Tax=Arabidopsis thaliana x Arabidopsis arenosa TaxID=1240361 RepID=A0A8T1Z4F3_9BRAS|nr:hypothetical protein ISN45_Aa06g035440 [Arabidopsis thaliana x Arabidopsis arenosa]
MVLHSRIAYKKIKQKLGRKLPKIKISKAMILPEQSVAAEKRKGLTLKDLLQQTSHCNAKLRQELQSHKYVIIQKLRELISDDDKLVRDSLYQLFETVIFPASKKDNLMVSLLMPYISCAMAHSSIDVRLMASKFEKILENYKDNS